MTKIPPLIGRHPVAPLPLCPQTGRIIKEPTEHASHDEVYISRLRVTDVQPEDDGEFTCRVQDHNGHTNSRSVNVTVFSESGRREVVCLLPEPI